TADHGNDPTWTGTDHTRERVPLLAYSPSMNLPSKLEDTHKSSDGRTATTEGVDLGFRHSFADIGQTILENFGLPAYPVGTSFLQQVKS
ncbi:MAG: hypothetical protein SO356_02365, partial [Veillonella caviae]|nr:hypothetical protein [Veillonella caviae]